MILLFDGICASCNFIVDFILKRDKDRRFRFASLQSKAGKALLREHHLAVDSMDTLVLIDGGRAYTYSTAAFRVFRALGWPWKALFILSLLPTNLTDAFYRLYARNRYRLFGKRAACRVPAPEERELFLEDS